MAKKTRGIKILNIVIPVYNEGDNFEATYRAIKTQIKTPHRVFVCYDFDEDNTLPVVKEIMRHDPSILLVKNTFGRGPRNALRSGFMSTKNDGPILVIMGDLCDDLKIVDKMYHKWEEGYKIVCASRYMKGGKQIGGPAIKRAMSKLAGASLFYIRKVPTHDITNNFRLYDFRVIQECELSPNGGFEVAMEITLKAFINGHKIAELPTTWRDRSAGKSKFKLLEWLPSYLYWYLYVLARKKKSFTPAFIPNRLYAKIVRNTPLPCVDIVPVRISGGKLEIGIIERATGSEAGKLAVIGGRIMLNETVTEAIARHLKNDLNIHTFSYHKINSEPRPFLLQQYLKGSTVRGNFGFDPTKHAVTPTYLVRIQGTPKPSNEASQYHWITKNELPKDSAYNQRYVMSEAFKKLS